MYRKGTDLMENISIAIDGPSGAGKSTIARIVADKLGFVYVDTGAMYRALGFHALKAGIPLEEIHKAVPLLSDIEIDIRFIDGAQRIFLNGEDISDFIRTEDASKYASAISALPEARAFLLSLQRSLADKNNVIMDGRDIGTVVLPDAQIKIYLTALDLDRAQRRYEELLARGEQVVYDSVLENIRTRDKNDSTRAVAPLKPAEDSIILDTTGNTLPQSIELIHNTILERMKNV